MYKAIRARCIAGLLVLVCIHSAIWARYREVSIAAFHAKGDGQTLNTRYIQQAIHTMALRGGGRVVVPAGYFVTGPLQLESGVELHLAKGAVLLGSANRLLYGKAQAAALISARAQHHVAITGSGTINGQGRELIKNMFRLLHAGQLQDNQWKLKRPEEKNRPKLLEFDRCTHVRVTGVLLKDAATWVQNYVQCREVVIDSLRVESTAYWNNDGIDIVDCTNVRISHCMIDAADDAICLKSEDPRSWCENIHVSDCTLRSSASAFKLGTGSVGGFRNITVRNLTIYDTYRSAIALEAVDGGFLEGVDIRGVHATHTGNALFIRLGHRNTDERYSTVNNIRIADVTATIPAGKPDIGYPLEGPVLRYPHNVFPASITGLPDHPVTAVQLDNISVTYEGGGNREMAFSDPDSLDAVPLQASHYPEFSMFGELPAWGLYLRYAQDIRLTGIRLESKGSDYRPACIADQVRQLYVHGLVVPASDRLPVLVLHQVPFPVLEQLQLPGNAGEAVLQR